MQDLLAKYPDSRAERIAEAAFRLSRTWGIPPQAGRAAQQEAQPASDDPFGVPPASRPVPSRVAISDENLSLGVAALDAFVEKFPGHKLAYARWSPHFPIIRVFWEAQGWPHERRLGADTMGLDCCAGLVYVEGTAV